jgi:probable F420-dependent oxidoreductase
MTPPIDLGAVGIWTFALDTVPISRGMELAAELDELGYGALWLPEAIGRNPMAHAALLGASTRHMTLATGVANVYARDAMAMRAAHETLTDALPDRFVLGLGISHQPAIEGIRGQTFHPPLTHMRRYLDDMDTARYSARPADTALWRVLGALGPRMLELAGDRCHGALTYNVTVDHTAQARHILGPDPVLAVELAVVFDQDRARAHEVARRHLARYLPLPNYANNLRRLGFADDEVTGSGSDRLVEALVAWGDVDRIGAAVAEHLDAGADHVCLQVLDPGGGVPVPAWRELAALADASSTRPPRSD